MGEEQKDGAYNCQGGKHSFVEFSSHDEQADGLDTMSRLDGVDEKICEEEGKKGSC